MSETLGLADVFRGLSQQIDLGGAVVQLGYVPAVTPAGHATLSTGTNPAEHGVLGRRWRSRVSDSSIELIVEAFEALGGPKGALQPSLVAKARAEYPGFVASLLFDTNLAAALDQFTIVASAKDFVSVILGGCSADVVIYPRLSPISSPSSQYVDVKIAIYCSERRAYPSSSTSGSGFQGYVTTTVAGEIRKAIESTVDAFRRSGAPLQDAARLKSLIKDEGWQAKEGQHVFSFPFDGALLAEWTNNVAIDRMYSLIAQAIARDRARSSPVTIVQSFFAPDYSAHMHGIRGGIYSDTVKQTLQNVVDLIKGVHSLGMHDVSFAVTSDHGGRHVDRIVDFRSGPLTGGLYLGRCPVALSHRDSSWYLEDFVGVFSSPAGMLPAALGERNTTAVIDDEEKLDYWEVPERVLEASFADGMPDLLVLPGSGRLFRRPGAASRKAQSQLLGGGHGASACMISNDEPHPLENAAASRFCRDLLGPLPALSDGWHLTPEEQFVPLIVGTTRGHPGAQDVARACQEQKDVRSAFLSII